MSEPKTVATAVEPVVEGVWIWTVSDDRLGGIPSVAAAVEEGPGTIVLVNPIRLAEEELDRLGEVTAILLTGPGHVRAAGHYREATGAAVWAPTGVDFEDVDPDETFTEGNEIPGGLRVIGLFGPSEAESAFYLKRAGGVVIVGDALVNIEEYGGLRILPKEYNPDPERTRRSCRKLLAYDFDVMVFGHGTPLRGGAREKLARLLET